MTNLIDFSSLRRKKIHERQKGKDGGRKDEKPKPRCHIAEKKEGERAASQNTEKHTPQRQN
jgi:hypothetical protein